jgi:ABC-type sugar transport system substrate-binding protein
MEDIVNQPLYRSNRASRRGRLLAVTAAAGAVVLVGACSSSSSSPSAGASSSQPAAASSSGAATLDATSQAQGTCTEESCTVYKSVPYSAYKGVKVGILNLAPVPGATRWSAPLQACLKAHGASVDYVDVGGDITKAGPTIQGWLSSGIKAVFDVGIPLDGQTSLIKQANSAKIPIITWGAGNPAGTISLDANQYVDGVEIAEYLINKIGDTGTIAYLSNSTNPALREREAGSMAVFGQYPKIKVQQKQVNTFSVEGAQQTAAAVLTASPNLSAIVGAYGDFGVGAANAVTRAGDKTTIVVSMNGDPEEYSAIRSGGPLKATIADGHEAGGQLACETGAVMLNGGQPLGTHMFLSSVFVDSSNLPPNGQTNDSPRTVETLGSAS